MSGSFNAQILVDKLAKLNNTQQSIETLSHWCIFHRNKARQVVDTWEKQFHIALRDQRVSFLYLANDILQNSRRKGGEFIAEFWRVLPGALTDVMKHGDESGRNASLRLVNIWEERKVFGSRGQILKEDLLGKSSEKINKDVKEIAPKLKITGGEMLEKLVSSYNQINNLKMGEESLNSKCQIAVNFVDKTEKEFGTKSLLGEKNASELANELESQQRVLGECIENLEAAKLSRNSLITLLREALLEQELKVREIESQIQVANSRFNQANKLLGRTATDPISTKTRTLEPKTLNLNPNPDDDRKSAAAAVAAKLAASTCSAQMLSLVFSSLASSNSETLTLNASPPDPKRPKLDPPLPQSQPEPVPPPPPFPSSPSKEDGTSTGTGTSNVPHLPVPPGLAVPGAMSVMGPIGGMVPFGYGSMGFPPMLVPPPFVGGPGPYQGFHGPMEGVNGSGLFRAPPSSFNPTLPPLNRP